MQKQKENMSFKVIIAGSCRFENYDMLKAKCDQLLQRKAGEGITVISGTARGADSLGERFAQERQYGLILMPADWENEGRSAGYKRNVAMAEKADALIAFWDGKSRGTEHMIRIARERGLPVRIVRF